ncbi:hypothetical protein IGI04_042626 [Brassica rapa subsp. trilocularis]|uniref:Uncharacterized protein n=1 Tax=Brassica rapa subsp. trilocularis TaxID=1813537 RepID=A0ABQ7KHV4_BRACM|nr:hypothetical protein IGI04_042626 [Brassica rapa subsp. trilocularis]
MAGDQNGKLTKEERLLLKSMNAHLQQMMDNNMGEFQKELRQKFLQQTDDLRQKNKKRMDSQKLEPRSPDSVQNKSSKHKWYKEEEAGRGQQSYKQTGHTSSRPHQVSRTPKSNIHSSYNQIVTKPQLYVFTGEGDYLKWERTMEKWLCYNKILKREALAYVMSQLKGNVFKWLLQEEDDRRYYKEPAITTWEDLKFLLRKKYASKGHTSLKSPKKKVISATDFKSEKSETKMADYEKEISSLVKEILKTSKHLDKQKKLPKNQEPVATVSELNDAEPDSAAPIQEAQTKTSMGKGKFEKEQEFSLFLPHSESNFDNSFDELTCLEPVQPSRIVSVSQVAKEDSAEKEPESTTQEEQQKNLQTESAHESLSYDLQEHCKEFNMVASVPRMFVKVLELELKQSDFCLKPCDSFARTEERSFVTNFHVHQLILDNSFVSAYVLNEPKKAEKCTGKKRGYTDESLAKLEMQQSNLGSCLAVNFDIGAVRGSYLSNPKELSNKLNCYGNYTHQGLTSNWNLVESFSYERVMDSTSEHAKVTNHVFKSSFIDYTDMMHLFLSKESCADYMEALKHAKTKNKHEEDKRFKPPDLSQERHQDVTCFILIKEAPPDATYKPKPIKYNFGIILLLYDVFACTMAGDQKGKLTKEERLLLKSMNAQMQQMLDTNMGEFRKELRQKFLQQTDDLRQQNKKRMDKQKLEPRPPDSVPNESSKHKWYKEEEAGRGQQSYKQPAHTSSRPHQASRTPKSNIHSSYNQIVTKPQLYVFTGEGDYLKWERTMEKWLCYNKILKREALAYVMSQLKGNIYKWLLQEEDDRRYYKEPAITTWEDLKFLLRKKYASKGHTSLKSPMKEVTSSKAVTCYIKEKTVKRSWFSEKDKKLLLQVIMDVEKQVKRTYTPRPSTETKHQEPVTTVSELKNAGSDSAATIQEVQTETSMQKEKSETEQECSLFLSQSELNFNNSCDELTCLKPVQPSRIVSVSQVAKEDSAEKEPESTTQEEQQKNLQTESAHESLSYDLQEHCKEFNMVASVPRIWRNHAVLCFGDILVYNTFFDMITHLTCPKRAEKCTGKKRGYTDESLAKLEMQQSNLGSCLAVNFDIGAVRGSYLSNPKELSNKLNCYGNYTHQGLTSNWNLVESFSYERVMDSTSRVILCLLCLNFSEYRTSQSYIWRPGTMAGDQNGKLTKEERLLLKSMNAHLQQMMDNNMGEFQKELRQKFLQQTDDLRQKNKKRMDSQKLEPRSPDSVQNKSSKHKWYKEEEAGRGQQSYKQTGHTSSRPHQASRTPKSNIHSSYNQIVTKPQLYVFTGEGDYLKWERTMEKWLCYNKILKREALAYVMSQLKGNVFKWLLQEEDDRRYYKEPAITTWEDLKLLLRKKYASKGHTSLKSPKKKVISATDFKSEKSETKMADYEKEISSLVKEILKTSKHLDKQKKLPKNQEPVATVSELNDAEPDSAAPIQEAQTKTTMGKGKFEKEQEFSLFLPHSESNFDDSFDELTCLEPVQPSRIVSVSQVAKEDSAEKEPESTTQEEQQKNLQTESAHESLSYDLQEHCKEFNMVASVPRMFVKVLELELKQFDFCLKPCDSFARTEERSFVTNFHVHKLILDNSFVSAYVLNEPKKLQEPKLHQSDFRFKFVKSAKFSEFELDCLCAKNDSKRVGLFFEDILVYNTFFDKPVAQLKLEFTDSECMNLILDDIWVCNIFVDMHNKWRNHAVLCFGDILVYNTFFDMITHLTCPKQAEKGTGEERGYNDQSIHDESLAKLEMQQSNLGNCLAARFNIGAVRGSYLSNQKELSNKLNCNGNYTHQGLTSNWNHVQSFSNERVMGSTRRVILCLLCLNFSEYRTSQSYIWRPGEHAKVTNHVFKSSFIDYTDMMHLFLSKESCADYMEALKHAKTKNKREEDKRFKPPDLSQERHQDEYQGAFPQPLVSPFDPHTLRNLSLFDSFLQGLSHLFQSIILGSHQKDLLLTMDHMH